MGEALRDGGLQAAPCLQAPGGSTEDSPRNHVWLCGGPVVLWSCADEWRCGSSAQAPGTA